MARLTALKVLLKYVWLLIWPRSLAWDYSYNQIPLATWGVGLAALAVVAAMLALTLWLYRSNAPSCFFGAFFFLALLPTSNLLLIIGSIMAERFLYLPSIGFAGCLVGVVLALSRRLIVEDTRRARLATTALAARGCRIRPPDFDQKLRLGRRRTILDERTPDLSEQLQDTHGPDLRVVSKGLHDWEYR